MKNTIKKFAQKQTWLFVTFCFLTHSLFASEYFLNSVSGNDSFDGKSTSAAWKTLTPLQALALQPGDIVNFACGSVWTKSAWDQQKPMLLIDDNGTADKPIIFRSYGTGDKPNFSHTFDKYSYPIRLSADYVTIDGLMVSQGYTGFDVTTGADYNVIKNCEIKNCGHGFIIKGQNNLFTKNYIHDLVMVVNDYDPAGKAGPKGDNDYGCVSFWFHIGNNEVSYNTSIDNIQPSFDYQFDGGFVEVYTNGDNLNIHHNWVENGMGAIEASLGKADNIKFAQNVFIENKGLSAIHFNNFTITNFKFENNTVINKKGTLWNDLLGGVNTEMTLRNNIFVCGGSSSERVAKTNSFNHSNNLYYLLDGAQLGPLTLGTGEKTGNPMFVNESTKDFQLQAGSPAVDAGANLGYVVDFKGTSIPKGNAPDMGAYEYYLPTGLSGNVQNSGNNLFNVYPNPVSNNLTIEIKGSSDDEFNIEILDLTGRMVLAQKQATGSLANVNTQLLGNGVYIVNVIIGQNLIGTRKIVVAHR